MPYCPQFLTVNRPDLLVSTVRLLAKEQFRARDVFPLDNPHQFNIDDSTNDVRAICDEVNVTIRLFCRYKKDVERFNLRIVNFAHHHPEMCGVVNEKGGDEEDEKNIRLTWKK